MENKYNLDLPIFIGGSFILICFGSAIGIIIQALTGTL
tara:strand:+ start:174 stop:287 length:114 start_codon:yes stop_codon:yes gene_type:complete